MAGDDLEDGLAYDVDLSSNEATFPVSDAEEPEAPKAKEPANAKKRKVDSKFSEKKKLKMQMDTDKKKNLAKESSVDVIVDSINEGIRRKNPDLSALEMAELYMKKSDFRSTAEFDDERTLDNLPKLLLTRFKNMLPSSTPGKKNKNKKSKKHDKKHDKSHDAAEESTDERKFIAIFSMSAIRACDVHRALRDVPGSSLKLINKNKVEVDLKLVQSTWSRILCCTPGRLQKVLADEGQALKKEEIKIVILDSSYLDKKLQNVFNIAETTEVLKQLTDAGSKVYLY